MAFSSLVFQIKALFLPLYSIEVTKLALKVTTSNQGGLGVAVVHKCIVVGTVVAGCTEAQCTR